MCGYIPGGCGESGREWVWGDGGDGCAGVGVCVGGGVGGEEASVVWRGSNCDPCPGARDVGLWKERRLTGGAYDML